MGVYVDIDLDYLVKPVKKESINNFRPYKNEECHVDNVEEFISKLREKGLFYSREKKFFTNHKKSYTYWWIRKSEDMTLIHIDAHSDLYRNRIKDLTLLRDTDMGCDDYIWYAIRDGYISKIYWVIPEGLYDLQDSSLAKRFIAEDMIIEYTSRDNKIEILFEAVTRKGIKKIEYTICTLDSIDNCDEINIMTVATSPEFIPAKADGEIFKALELLGASEEETERIKVIHKELIETV